MTEMLRILTEAAGVARNCLWLSLHQPPDGAVSTGFTDDTFSVPGPASEIEVDGRVHVEIMNLAGTREARELTNPHFTFHPPNHMHLRADRQAFLAEQLVMMDLQVPQDGRVPWLTFVSERIDQLNVRAAGRHGANEREIVVRGVSDESSIAINVDFIDSLAWQQERTGSLLDHVETWPCEIPRSMVTDWFLHLTADAVWGESRRHSPGTSKHE